MTEKVTSSIQFTRETMPGAQYYDGKMLKIPITEEAGIQLYKRWFMQGISSIMSSIASQHMSKLNEYERNRVQKCSQAAENINEQARCVIRVIDFKPKQMNFTKMSRIQKLKEHLDMKYKKVNGASVQSSSRHRLVYVKPKMNSEKIIFRTKREVINRQNYKLRTEYDRLTPFGILGKYLTKMTKAIKNKAPHSSWKKTMKAIEIMKRNKEQRHRFFENIEKRLLSDEQVKYFESKLTPVNEEKDFVEEFHVPNHIIKRLRKNNENAQKTLEIIRLFQRSIKLALILNGANGTKLANKTFIFGSPRLLSLVPNDIQNE
ncbi:unnamed protein product, partial [Thelazia callipaeda]|uniref:Uncharacterized protein n=1 Tax=Thelazia callipaeda TaxID=103827 RepID=A0A0N5CRI8_THECL